MKLKSLLALLATFAAFSSTLSAQGSIMPLPVAANESALSYVSDDNKIDGVTFVNTPEDHFLMYVRYDSYVMRQYIGRKLVAVDFGAGRHYGVKRAVLVSYQDPTKTETWDRAQWITQVQSATDPDKRKPIGWVRASLDEPLEIVDDRPLWVGYFVDMGLRSDQAQQEVYATLGNAPVGTVYGDGKPMEEAMMFAQRFPNTPGQETWTRQIGHIYCSLRAVFEGGQDLARSAAVMGVDRPNRYFKKGDMIAVAPFIQNTGKERITSMTLELRGSDSQSERTFSGLDIPSNGHVWLDQISFDTPSSFGRKDFVVKAINGQSLAKPIAYVPMAYVERPVQNDLLFETYGLTNNQNIPYQDQVIRQAIEETGVASRAHIVSLHTGESSAKRDAYSLQGVCTNSGWLYGKGTPRFTPAIMLNRTYLGEVGAVSPDLSGTLAKAKTVVFYPQEETLPSIIREYDKQQSICYFDLDLKGEVSADGTKLSVFVSGKPLVEDVAPLGGMLLGAFLLESGISSQQAGVEGMYNQNDVIRALGDWNTYAQPYYGNATSWPNNNVFSRPFTFDLNILPAGVNKENLSVLVFATQVSQDSPTREGNAVYNVKRIKLKDFTGVSVMPVAASDEFVGRLAGRTLLLSDTAIATVFDLNGSVQASTLRHGSSLDLPAGIYIVRVQDQGKVHSFRAMIP